MFFYTSSPAVACNVYERRSELVLLNVDVPLYVQEGATRIGLKIGVSGTVLFMGMGMHVTRNYFAPNMKSVLFLPL